MWQKMDKKRRYTRVCKNCENTFETDQKYSKLCSLCNPYSKILEMPMHPSARRKNENL